VTEIKLIVTGSMGAGKTTFVTAISDFPPVRTDVPITADQVRGDKTTTTVALDYGAMTLDDGRRLLIFGTPGQRRYDFMCRILARGALGVVILIDHAGDDPEGDLGYYVDLFRETIADTGAVVGVTHVDEKPGSSLHPYHEVLASRELVLPVFSIDARRQDHIVTVCEALIAMIP
jgi:signal recognition particle receptor subunit beta